MPTNGDILRETGQVMNQIGIAQKADGVNETGSLTAGQFSNRAQVERLVDLTVNLGGWTSQLTRFVRSQRAGQIPRATITEPVTEATSENILSANDYQRIEPDFLSYNCQKLHVKWAVTLEEIREAAASGTPMIGNAIQQMMAKAMINDLARLFVMGDNALSSASKENRLLKRWDGAFKQAKTSANVRYPTTATGKAFDGAMFDAMYDTLPDKYKHDDGLNWWMSSRLDQSWRQSLTTLNQTPTNQVGSGLRDSVIQSRTGPPPLGIPLTVIPQIPTNDKGTTSAIAPTSVADDGDGTCTVVLTTLLSGSSFAGRRVKVTNTTTGASETLVVAYPGSVNTIYTAGSLHH